MQSDGSNRIAGHPAVRLESARGQNAGTADKPGAAVLRKSWQAATLSASGRGRLRYRGGPAWPRLWPAPAQLSCSVSPGRACLPARAADTSRMERRQSDIRPTWAASDGSPLDGLFFPIVSPEQQDAPSPPEQKPGVVPACLRDRSLAPRRMQCKLPDSCQETGPQRGRIHSKGRVRLHLGTSDAAATRLYSRGDCRVRGRLVR